jgi:hypothetical protein
MAVLTKKMQDSAQRIQVLKEQLLASQAPKRK